MSELYPLPLLTSICSTVPGLGCVCNKCGRCWVCLFVFGHTLGKCDSAAVDSEYSTLTTLPLTYLTTQPPSSLSTSKELSPLLSKCFYPNYPHQAVWVIMSPSIRSGHNVLMHKCSAWPPGGQQVLVAARNSKSEQSIVWIFLQFTQNWEIGVTKS